MYSNAKCAMQNAKTLKYNQSDVCLTSDIFSRNTQWILIEMVSQFTAFGLKLILNNFKPDNHLYLLNVFILDLPARNTNNLVPATLHKFAIRIKHWYTGMLILRIV